MQKAPLPGEGWAFLTEHSEERAWHLILLLVSECSGKCIPAEPGRTLLLLWSPLSKVSPAASTVKSSMCSWSLILNYFSIGFISVLRKISQCGNSYGRFGHLQDEVSFLFSESDCSWVKNKALKVQKWHFPLKSGMLKPGTILAKQTLWPHFTLLPALLFMLKYRYFSPQVLKTNLLSKEWLCLM